MMLADQSSSTIRLLTSGPVPWWLGLLILLGAGIMVAWQLRRDFSGMKISKRMRRTLAGLRIAIVLLMVWLICQPVLLIVRRWTAPPQVMLVVDGGASMQVNESSGGLSRQLDALEAVGRQPIARRNNASSQIARACGSIARLTSAALLSLQEDQATATTGLPLGPAVARKIDALAVDLKAQADGLNSARALLPPAAADAPLKQSLAAVATESQLIASTIESIAADGAVVGRQAPKSPSLLDAYITRLKKLATDAQASQKHSADLQEKLDKALLTEKEQEELRAKAITRQALAEMAADRLSAPQAGAPAWERRRSGDVSNLLDDAFRKTLDSPLAGVLLLSDGSSPISGAADSSLARLKIPVSTVLIGADGEEPPDAGLVAVDVPRLALTGEVVTIRCLVKNLVGSPAPKLSVKLGSETIATRDLAVKKDGFEVVEFSWTPTAPARVQLTFQIDSAQPDAYPGNERSAAVVDVIANKARALVVSDRLSNDFAAIGQILAGMPAVDAKSILAAPGFPKFRTGNKAGEFPATADDLKALSLLVLVGDVPEGAGDEVVQAVKQAIDAGLRVWVQTPATESSAKSWATALGIQYTAIEGKQSIQPAGNLWLSLYELGQDQDESLTAWKNLPAIAGFNEIRTNGIPLLVAGERPILQLVNRNAGAIIVSGVTDFTPFRTRQSAASVNRILAESLALGLAPITEPGQPGGIFPAQPIVDHGVHLIGSATAGKGLNEAPAGAAKSFAVTDPQAIMAQIGGQPVTRVVRRLVRRQDFQLAAHDAPLEQISKATGGRHRDLLSVGDALPPGLKGSNMSSATRIALWPGAWSLVLLLLMVSAEYLLRRRAGKVM